MGYCKTTLLFFIFSLFASTLLGQNLFYYDLNYKGFFDNREYFNDYSSHGTIFGQNLRAHIGVEVQDNSKLTIGAITQQWFGNPEPNTTVYPEIFYSVKKNFFEITFGIFPIHIISDIYSNFQFSDTILYYRPYASGFNIKLGKEDLYQQFWIDWIGRKKDFTKEELMIGVAGITPITQKLSLKNAFKIHHIAVSELGLNEHINDNISGEILADFKHNMDNIDFNISTGLACSFDRLRNIYGWETGIGSLSKVTMTYKILSTRMLYYVGNRQNVVSGDKLYGAKSYGRADFIVSPFKINPQKLKLMFSLHLVESTLNFSQLISINMDLNGPLFKDRNISSSLK